MSTSKLLDVTRSAVLDNLAYWPVVDHSFIENFRQLRMIRNQFFVLCASEHVAMRCAPEYAALTKPNHTCENMLIVSTKENDDLKYLFSDLYSYHKPYNDMKITTLLNCSSTAFPYQEMINPHHQAQDQHPQSCLH